MVPSSKIARHRYHHGDLANALIAAALELARAGGPDAVVLREAARKTGVSATAAYRYFASREDLIHAVKDRALGELAERMEQELERAGTAEDAVEQLRLRLRALGSGYISFALERPGLFRTAFARVEPMTDREGIDPMRTRPFLMVVDTLDRLVASGAIRAERRQFLEVAAWATVHGMAELLLDGPMRRLPPDLQRAAVERALDMVADGITAS